MGMASTTISTVIIGADVKEVRSLKLFDRWGNWVFEGAHLLPNDLNNGWDGTFRGKEMDPAVFVWLAEIELWNGDVGFYKGDLTLVR